MRHYQLIRRTPTGDLSVAEHGVLQLEHAMLQVRKKANEIRVRPWMTYQDMHYVIGFFNGVRFTVFEALDYSGRDYRDFEELAERYACEADYLAGPYLERSAA